MFAPHAARGLALFVTITIAGGCHATPPEPIVLDGGAVTVRNVTEGGWQRVQIFVNEYYAGTAREIPAGGFVRSPLDQFKTIYGQKFDYRTTAVFAVVVKATGADGQPVRLVWGKPGLR